jgi:hypothetical protein
MRRAALLGIATALACTTVEPTLIHPPLAPIRPGDKLFVSAQRDRERVVRALEQAGFQVTNGEDAGYAVAVDVGKTKWSQGCGSLHNVRYTLIDLDPSTSREVFLANLRRGDLNQGVLEIKGRGWTGDCESNIYDQMSRALAGQLSVSAPPR